MSISKLFKIRVNEYKWQICALTIGTRRGTQFCKEGGNACPRSSEASFCFAVPRLKPWSQFHAVLAQGGSQFHAALHQHSTVGSQFHVGDPNSMWGIPIPCGDVWGRLGTFGDALRRRRREGQAGPPQRKCGAAGAWKGRPKTLWPVGGLCRTFQFLCDAHSAGYRRRGRVASGK